MMADPLNDGTKGGFVAELMRGVRQLTPLAWAFLAGGGACVALMGGGLAYSVLTNSQLPRLSLYVLEDGENFFRAGDPAAALREFEAAVAVSPADTKSLVNLGAVAYALRDRARAAHAFREALRFDSDNPEASYYLGVMYLQDNRVDEAIELIERSVSARSGPEAASAWNDLGVAYERKGQLDRARDCFRRALELDPQFRRARQNLARVQQQTGGAAP